MSPMETIMESPRRRSALCQLLSPMERSLSQNSPSYPTSSLRTGPLLPPGRVAPTSAPREEMKAAVATLGIPEMCNRTTRRRRRPLFPSRWLAAARRIAAAEARSASRNRGRRRRQRIFQGGRRRRPTTTSAERPFSGRRARRGRGRRAWRRREPRRHRLRQTRPRRRSSKRRCSTRCDSTWTRRTTAAEEKGGAPLWRVTSGQRRRPL